MGKDKGLINYHGMPQREYLCHLLEEICDDVFLSIRSEQVCEVPSGFKNIVDQNDHKGPYNGILSAFKAQPNVAWLVLACDLPLINLQTIGQLISGRNPNKTATAFANPETGEPEPLACIWEVKGLEESLQFLEDRNTRSPKKFLMNADIALVHPKYGQDLFNANSPQDYDFVKRKLEEREGG
ncbi:NTP transferase domain-containing protein [Muricauda oceani]|uniref:NTP transferase domain-containing protein n=2 Tax=Flagellimonas oceani TaxID=2698672 RepID=A0A6G7J8F5_9FLAO|nr:NTP transferase domain-containing protein [Allomuricauda oceani]QII47106.1 NTP transferase domain-containing protein [Allomuricauda oceani]